MAITIIQEPSAQYPAYNDCWIKFSSDIAVSSYAEIEVSTSSLFANPFIIYPNSNGVFTFNLKHIITAIYNVDGFADINGFDTPWGASIVRNHTVHNFNLKVIDSVNVTEDLVTKAYTFFRSVNQLLETIFTVDYHLLIPFESSTFPYLPYFYGFPYFFDIYYAESGNVTLNNVTTTSVYQVGTATEEDSFRIYLDRSNNQNLSDLSLLDIKEGENRLIVTDGTQYVEPTLDRKNKCKGVYLKWANFHGGYSFWLFDRFYTERFKQESIGEVFSNNTSFVDENTGDYISLGKEGEREIVVKASLSEREFRYVKDIIFSPHVEMYTSEEANVLGYFINVNVKGDISRAIKKHNNKIQLTIQLPEIKTMKM